MSNQLAPSPVAAPPLVNSTPCRLAGFSSETSGGELAGISLVYLVDKIPVEVGHQLTFTAWILNATSDTLTDVALTLRSLTNARLDQLSYTTQPEPWELQGRTLGPRQSLRYVFSYEVQAHDVEHDGLLISAIAVDLVTPGFGRVHSECDTLAFTICPANTRN